MSYTIGFGTIKDDEQATLILHKYSLESVDLQSQIQRIIDGIQEPSYESGLFPMLQSQGIVQYIDLPQYYREKKLLKKAEISYKREIESTQLVFGQLNLLHLQLKVRLAGIYMNQGRLKEAEEMHRQELALWERLLGKEHPSTLTSMNNLAEVLSSQGKYEEAEEMHGQALAYRY